MSGEVRLVAGMRLAEGDSVSVAVVNGMFSGMTGKVVAGAVGARELADGCITAAKLSDAVSEALAIPDGSIPTAKLADGCLSADDAGRLKMGDDFVTADQLAADAVETAKLADGAVTAVKLVAGVDVAQLRNEQADVDGAQGSRFNTQSWSEIMSVAVTPSAVSSKVLVLFSGVTGPIWRHVDAGPVYTEQQGAFKLTRTIGGSETELLLADSAGSRGAATGGVRNGITQSLAAAATTGAQVHVPYLDSPASVAAVTYKVYVREAKSSAWGVFGPNSCSDLQTSSEGRQPKSSLIVLEVIQA